MSEGDLLIESNEARESEAVEPIDLSKVIEDKRVLFVADSHTSADDKRAFRTELPQLADLGVTDLAFEMLPAGFNTEDEEAVKDYLREHWRKDRNMDKEYFDIYLQARANGMRVWGIDIPAEEYQESSVGASFQKRNEQWAGEIQGHLQADPNARIVVLHGMAHAGYYPAGGRVNNILADKGIGSVVVHHYGGDHQDTILQEERMMQKVTQGRSDPFMVKISTPSRSADYMIHQPRQESA